MTPEDFQVPAPATTQEPWNRAICPLCGRLATRRHMDINSPAARSVEYWCPTDPDHRWRTTWARP